MAGDIPRARKVILPGRHRENLGLGQFAAVRGTALQMKRARRTAPWSRPTAGASAWGFAASGKQSLSSLEGVAFRPDEGLQVCARDSTNFRLRRFLAKNLTNSHLSAPKRKRPPQGDRKVLN